MEQIPTVDEPVVSGMTEADADYIMKRISRIERIVNDGTANPLKALDVFIEIADYAISKLLIPVTCRAGCDHCCHVAVGLTGIEARYIEKRTGRKVKRYESGPRDINERRPCPFLKDKKCSIYTHRPATCRVFVSFDDPKICEDPKGKHAMIALNPPGKGGIEWLNALYCGMMMNLVSRNPEYKKLNDIRGFFGD